MVVYEVEVEVFTGSKQYRNYPVISENRNTKSPALKGAFSRERIVKMFSFDNCTKEQAINKGKKHGKVKSCRKVDAYESLLSIEKMELEPMPTVYDQGNQYVNPIAMSEFVWQKKGARRRNYENIKKDKLPLDE